MVHLWDFVLEDVVHGFSILDHQWVEVFPVDAWSQDAGMRPIHTTSRSRSRTGERVEVYRPTKPLFTVRQIETT